MRYNFELMVKDVPLSDVKMYIPEKNFKFQFDGEFEHIGKMKLTQFARLFGPVLP